MPHNRPPRGYRPIQKVSVSPATRRGILAAIEAIQAPSGPERSADELLAERERMHQESQAAEHRQGSLILRGGR